MIFDGGDTLIRPNQPKRVWTRKFVLSYHTGTVLRILKKWRESLLKTLDYPVTVLLYKK